MAVYAAAHRSADLAHLVERHLAKVEVASSSLVIRSKALAKAGAMLLFLQKCSRSAKVKAMAL